MKDDQGPSGEIGADEDSAADVEERAAAGEPGSDDFAARNVIMSNALPGVSAVAGAISQPTDPYLEPRTDEERLADEAEPEGD